MKNKGGVKRTCYIFLVLAFLVVCAGGVRAQENLSMSADTLILRHIASLRNSLTHVRMVSFENISVADQYKTAGIIEELLNRAEQTIFHLLPTGRYEWSWAGFDQPREMVAYAEELINTLSSGKDPFEGKYSEPGGYVVDHALIKKDGLHHLFYIRGTAVTNWPEYPLFNFGHAVSQDLIHWKTEDPVLQCPATGWDQYQVWAPHIIEHNGIYYMFYAGVNKNVCQAICLATSTDLYNWKRSEKNPVISPGSWGIWNADKWSDCRDPMILQDGSVFYCYYTATKINAENGQSEYCMGISSSEDLLNWKDEGFVRLKHSLTTPPESPFVVRNNGLYYLIYTNYKHGIVYATSQQPVKGWKELPVEKMVLMAGVSASEIYQDDGKWYMSYISHQKNGLHFFEIKELQWNRDGSISINKTSE
ncbi:MAG: family 43 glycosylhydrolase [Bacteroidales bacterium]